MVDDDESLENHDQPEGTLCPFMATLDRPKRGIALHQNLKEMANTNNPVEIHLIGQYR